MNSHFKLAVAAVFICGATALAPDAASAMPVAKFTTEAAPAVEQVHAVRVCNRWGRCWWTAAGHRHGGYAYGWRRPYYHGGYGWHGGRYGWRGGYHGGRYGRWGGGHRGHWR